MTDDSIQQNLDHWEGIFSTRAWGRYPPEELVRFIARRFGGAKNRSAIKILEVGCGPGANLWYLAKERFSIAGIDGSATAIVQAAERLRSEHLPSEPPRVDLREGNFASLPWPDETFDAVVDIEAIYANPMDGIRSCIGEIHRTLVAGGTFFGKMFGDETSGAGSGRVLEDGTSINPIEGPCAGTGFAHFFSEAELRQLFSAFSTLELDWVHRSDHQQSVEIFEWLVTARK